MQILKTVGEVQIKFMRVVSDHTQTIITVILEESDLQFSSRKKEFEKINAHDFSYDEGLKTLNTADNVIYIDPHGKMKILKSRYGKDHA